jgi:conjugal transfer pilus assembly protein TraF
MSFPQSAFLAQARPVLAAATLCLAGPLPAQPSYLVDEQGATSFFKSSRQGWFWYHDPLPPEPPASAPSAAAPSPAPIDRDLAGMRHFQQSVQDALDVAVYNPSDRNIARFLEIWAESRRKASDFEEIARAAAVRMPWVDDTAQGVRPTNPAAQRVFDQVTAERNDELMRRLAKTHGLYFFFRAACPYCHAFSPMLKQFEQKFGFTVFPISLDGGGLPLYPHPQRDNGMAAAVMAQLGIPEGQFQTPFTVLANPATHSLLPVGFGPMTADEMVERIALLVRLQEQSGDGTAGSVLPPSPVPARTSATALTRSQP